MLLAIHFLAYGYALGSASFNSFVAAVKSLETLPRRQFGELQSNILPIQFATQSIAPLIIGITAPYTISTAGVTLLAASALGGVANWAYLTPKCAVFKTQRWAIVDSKYAGDNDAATAAKENGEDVELAAIDKHFGKWHGASMASNLVSILSMAAYAFVMSGKLKVV